MYLFHAEPFDEAVHLINLYLNRVPTRVKDGHINIQIHRDEIPELVAYLVNNDIKVYGVIPTNKSFLEGKNNECK